MSVVYVYDLPALNTESDIAKVERKFCELNTKYRNGTYLDEVEITWMDQANTFLSQI